MDHTIQPFILARSTRRPIQLSATTMLRAAAGTGGQFSSVLARFGSPARTSFE